MLTTGGTTAGHVKGGWFCGQNPPLIYQLPIIIIILILIITLVIIIIITHRQAYFILLFSLINTYN